MDLRVTVGIQMRIIVSIEHSNDSMSSPSDVDGMGMQQRVLIIHLWSSVATVHDQLDSKYYYWCLVHDRRTRHISRRVEASSWAAPRGEASPGILSAMCRGTSVGACPGAACIDWLAWIKQRICGMECSVNTS